MNEEIKKPTRQYTVTLKIEVDDIDDLQPSIENVQFQIEKHLAEQQANPNKGWYSVTGGSHSSYVVEIVHEVGKTHDQWYEELKAYLGRRD